ncbi:MAG: DUF4837 family protein [Balneolaceae bacterium]
MKMNKQNIGLLLLLAGFLFSTACEGDYRQRAIGDNVEIFVVMDSTLHESETAAALRETFGRYLQTIPGQPEELYTLRFRDFRSNEELEQLQKYKNLIFAGPIDDETNASTLIRGVLSDEVEERVRSGESFAFPLNNHWYRDQWALVLTSSSDSELAENIRRAEEELVGRALDRELARWEESIYERAEQVEVSDSLWNRNGWSVRMQHDYVQTVDTSKVIVYRRYLPNNNRWMWAWWQDDVPDAGFVNPEWINATRDSLMEIYMRGERPQSYLQTDYNRGLETREIDRDDRIVGWETMGIWEMTADLMGGPFVNFTYYDPETERLFMIEYGQFAPNVGKRRFVHQFRAMGRTFESDSTFTPDRYEESDGQQSAVQ